MTKKLLTSLLFLGCLIGGAVSASVILLVTSLCVFGIRDFEHTARFIDAANPIALALGGICGVVVFLRSRVPSKLISSASAWDFPGVIPRS